MTLFTNQNGTKSSGSSNLSYIAEWNGTEWIDLGGGMNSDIDALGAAAKGDIAERSWAGLAR